MRLLRSAWFSLRGFFASDRVASEIDEELAFHMEREARLYEQRKRALTIR